MTVTLTAEQDAAIAAAAAMLRVDSRDAFERDVMALLERGLSVADAIKTCLGIVPTDELWKI